MPPKGAAGLSPGLNGTKIRRVWDVSSPRRGREGSARGFNPGNTVRRRRALKGRQIKRRHNAGQTCTHLSPFQGEPFVWMVPRVETWVETLGLNPIAPSGQKPFQILP